MKKYKLLLLFFVFVSPFVIAWFMYQDRAVLQGKLGNHGQLLQPPISITQLQLTNEQSQSIDNTTNQFNTLIAPSALRTNGQWLLMLFYPGLCDQICQQRLYYIRQIRTATDTNSERVERAILTYKVQDPNLIKLLSGPFAGTRHLYAIRNQVIKVLKNTVQPGTIYIVDPLGNIVLAYPVSEKPENMLADLQRLLQASQIG